MFAFAGIGAGAAQAAIAGAPHEVTSNRPDLVSSTILPSAFGNAVDFCFDKTLTNASNILTPDTAGKFRLGGYRSRNVLRDNSFALETTLSPPSGLPADSCIRAVYNIGHSSSIDLPEYTIGTVMAGSVAANGGVPSGADGNNHNDSTPLTGSNTHNGTAGFTTGPDLASVIPDSTSNSISYFFDQAISGNPSTHNFWFVDSAGNVCQSTVPFPLAGGSFGDNFVTISFAGDICHGVVGSESVSNAVRAGDFAGAVTSANDNSTNLGNTNGSSNVDNELAVPGASDAGATSKPDLTDVKLESNQSAMDFTFNKTVTPDNPADFFADLSNGTMVAGNNATVIAVSTSSTTIRVTFRNFPNWDEYVIGGSVEGPFPDQEGACAVFISAVTSDCNTPASQPIDAPFGNIGAFATGWTTGADVMGAVGNTTNNEVAVALDQRAFFANNGAQLLDGTGNTISTAGGTSWTLPAQPAGPQVATITFSSGQVGLAKNLFLPFDTLETALQGLSNTNPGPGTDCRHPGQSVCQSQPNVDQIVALVKTSSLVRAAKHARPMSRAQAARQARLTQERRAAAARKLAAFLRTHHRSHRR